MKEKIFNPASTNNISPAPGMAAVNTFNEEELDSSDPNDNESKGVPKNIDREEKSNSDDNNKKPS